MFKTFEELKQDLFDLKQIPNIDNYFAHLKEDENKNIIDRETLFEHTENIKEIFLSYNQILNWDELIDRLILDIFENFIFRSLLLKENTITKIGEQIGSLIKLFFLDGILFHDYGKLNPKFQKDRMKNNLNKKTNFTSEHALLSAIFYVVYYYDKTKREVIKLELEDKETNFLFSFLIFFVMLFSLSLKNHHHPEIGDISIEVSYKYKNYKKEDYIELDLPFDFSHLDLVLDQMDDIINADYNYKELFINEYNYFSLFSLEKLHFSILNRIDYLATSKYYFDIIIKKPELILTKEDKKQLYEEFYQISYNQELLKLQEIKNVDNLNILRTQIALEVRENINKFYKENIFYLQSPTGSGKTNLSFLCVVELLSKRKDLNKVFYVLPFNSLSDQIYTWLNNNFLKEKNKIFQIHSYVGFLDIDDRNNQKEEIDAKYGNERAIFLDYLFLNFPILVMSHVRFFGILKTSSKQENYFLSQIHNSIVIIDEIQSYPPKEWDKIKFFIENYSKLFNICFIIMSATLPKIHSIKTQENNREYRSLLENSNKYFSHSLFRNRVKFNFNLIEETKKIKENREKLEVIYNYFINILPHFIYKENLKIVVELITKKSAYEFYKYFKEKSEDEELLKDFKFLFLSGTILFPLRKKILKEIQNNQKVILITTQVIEAGMDLDFDLGFKDIAILDSEEQLAGRINRNALKSDCYLYLFDYSKTGRIYRGDYRYKILANIDDKDSVFKEFLENKNFDSYYQHILKFINLKNETELIMDNFKEFTEYFKNINFSNINKKFEIIDSHTISIFIPIKIEKEYFKPKEIQFLKDLKLNTSKYIDGKEVWDAYLKGMKNKNYFDKMVFFEKLNSILSNYIINIFYNENLLKNLIEYSNSEYLNYTNILYLENYEEIYSIENGLDIEKLKSAGEDIIL